MELYKNFVCHPTVCAVGDNYQIMIPVKHYMLIRIKVGDKYYYNHSNGVRISVADMQKIDVPAEELDKAKEYTVLCRDLRHRKAYCSHPSKEVGITYSFKPIEKDKEIKIFHVADTHGHVESAYRTYKQYGEDIDLLIFNGDVADSSDTYEDILVLYKIASKISQGSIPCIFSRGNHDLRGRCAAELDKFMPTQNGLSYYTFRLGCIWGIILDCGEDKDDSHEEYGETVCCNIFRREENKFLKKVVESADYNVDDIKYKLVISHNPFFIHNEPPFNIEEELYSEWCDIIEKSIKPNLMLCGHTHQFKIFRPTDEDEKFKAPCTVIIGSQMKNKREKNPDFGGLGLELNGNSAKVTFALNNEILSEENINI